MSHPRSLTDEEALQAEQWFSQYERVGTFSAKARELGVTRDTLRDAIRRVRNQDTTATRRKMSALEVDQLACEILGGVLHVSDVERRQSDEQQLDTNEAMSGK